jgi:hypothetical protein
LLFESLGAALANSTKADRSDDFYATEKGATPERRLKKKRGTLLWEQPNETYVH